MASHSILLRLPPQYRIRDAGVFAMYVPSLGLSLVNLTGVFFSLGRPGWRKLHPKSLTHVLHR